MNAIDLSTASPRAAFALAALLALPLASGCSVQASVDVTGTAPGTASHLWLTVDEVWLATNSDTVPESTSGWQKFTLSTPVTIDLANVTATSLVQAVTGQKLPAGTYRQLHFVVEDSGDPLSSAAQSLGLTYNAELTFTNASGTVVTAPLEFPAPGAGLTIPIDVTFTSGIPSLQSSGSSAATPTDTTTPTSPDSTTPTTPDFTTPTTSDTTTTTPTTTFTPFFTSSTTPTTASTSMSTPTSTSTSTLTSTTTTTTTVSLAATIDAGRDVVSYSLGTNTAYILSPLLRADDESTSGAISGSIDVSALPAGHAPVFVSAEAPDATQTHHVVIQRSLVGADGSFTLYPLPVVTQGSQTYDLVIAGAGSQTVIVRGVPVTAGPVSSPTMVQSAPIALAAASTVYADLATQGPVLPAGSRVDFFQTIAAAGEIPYLIDSTAIDPRTRHLPADAFALATDSLAIGSYTSGGTISFASASPVEGNGGYLVGTEGLFRADTLDVKSTLLTGTVTAPTLVIAPSPALVSGALSGTLTVSLTASGASLDTGFITVSSGGRIVDTTDISRLLQAGGGTATISGIPAGSTLAPSGGPAYQLSVRAWNTSNPTGTITRSAASSSINLGNSAVASAAIQVP
jgi:hypothetical protein